MSSWELAEYRYREKFHLSYEAMMNEPLDRFFTNIKIMQLEGEKSRIEQKRSERKRGSS